MIHLGEARLNVTFLQSTSWKQTLSWCEKILLIQALRTCRMHFVNAILIFEEMPYFYIKKAKRKKPNFNLISDNEVIVVEIIKINNFPSLRPSLRINFFGDEKYQDEHEMRATQANQGITQLFAFASNSLHPQIRPSSFSILIFFSLREFQQNGCWFSISWFFRVTIIFQLLSWKTKAYNVHHSTSHM